MHCWAHNREDLFLELFGGGWIDENSVGPSPKKRILASLSAWLIRNRLMIEFSPPEVAPSSLFGMLQSCSFCSLPWMIQSRVPLVVPG